PVEPSDTMTFSLYGITAFTVQGWDGASWVTLGSVSGNTLVKRTVNFAAYTTDRIRINVTASLAGYSRITEVEAWSAGPVNLTTTTLASSANPTVAGSSPDAERPLKVSAIRGWLRRASRSPPLSSAPIRPAASISRTARIRSAV